MNNPLLTGMESERQTMHPLQRRAWFELVTSLSTLLLVAATWPWLGYAAMGFFGFLGLMGFSVLFFRRPHYRALIDERDQAIDRAAQTAGFQALYFVLLAAFLAAVFAKQDTVPMNAIAAVMWTSATVLFLVRSFVILWKYRGNGGHAASA